MKLQFAFGNPRKGKKAKRKSVAKRRKKANSSSVKHKLKKAVAMAKKIRRKRKVARKHHKRKNPQTYLARRDGKIIGRGRIVLDKRQEDAARGRLIQLMSKYKSLPLGNERAAVMREMAKLKGSLNLKAAELKTMERYAESGAKVTKYDVKEKAVAKKKKPAKKKSSSKKKTAKKSGGKKRSRAQKAALKKMQAAAKKARKAKKSASKRNTAAKNLRASASTRRKSVITRA